jgi:hypothetical protein
MEWVIPAAFTLAVLTLWLEHQARQREANFRQETYRKMLEQPGGSVEAVRVLLREDEARRREEQAANARLGGMLAMATGVGISVVLYAITPAKRVFLVGLIPVLVGLVLFAQSLFIGRGSGR